MGRLSDGDTRVTCQIDHMIPKKSRVAMKQNEQGKGVDFHRTKTVFMSFELGQGRGGVLASLASTAGSRRRGNRGAYMFHVRDSLSPAPWYASQSDSTPIIPIMGVPVVRLHAEDGFYLFEVNGNEG